jgi:hypothetical protein
VKAGTAFGKIVTKWSEKSGPELLTDTARMGIIMSSAGVLHLMGLDMFWASAMAIYGVTGKAPKDLFKGAPGH